MCFVQLVGAISERTKNTVQETNDNSSPLDFMQWGFLLNEFASPLETAMLFAETTFQYGIRRQDLIDVYESHVIN